MKLGEVFENAYCKGEPKPHGLYNSKGCPASHGIDRLLMGRELCGNNCNGKSSCWKKESKLVADTYNGQTISTSRRR